MCDSCEVVYINGVKCHETNCPDAWIGSNKECKWCGTVFELEYSNQDLCSIECEEDYYS